MNSKDPNMMHDGNGYEHLDAELAAFARALDDAGAADRARMRPEVAERALLSSLGSLHGTVEVNAQMSELGALDRATAPANLEDRVFEASRAELVGASAAASLRLAGAGDFPPQRVVVRSIWTSGRLRTLAAALLIGAAGIFAYISTRSPSPIMPDGHSGLGATNIAADDQSTEALAARISSQMDTLFVAMESVPSSSADSSDTEFNPEWLDDLSPGSTGVGGAS